MKEIITGGYRAQPVLGSSLWLDGGAMFGVVPKSLWKDKTRPDDKNRIHLAAEPLLLRGGGKTILLEGGTSLNFDEKMKKIYRVGGDGLEEDLGKLGVEPGDVDLVIMTHLHFDHAGGLVKRDPAGGLSPTFPRARIVVQAMELEDALNPPAIRAASYRTDDLALLNEAGLFETVDGTAEVAPAIIVEPATSHTRGHQTIRIGEGSETVVFVGDLIPTAAHINPAWLMAYDLYPAECSRARGDLLERAAEQGWTLYFYHDPVSKAGTVSRNERGKYTFVPLS